jgi:hypothetical protein
MPFSNGKPDGMAPDVVTGFFEFEQPNAWPPMGWAIVNRAHFLIADDVGNPHLREPNEHNLRRLASELRSPR